MAAAAGRQEPAGSRRLIHLHICCSPVPNVCFPTMGQDVRLILFKEIPEDAKLRQQWNALVERMDQPQVFYTYEWALAVQRAYRATLHTLLFLAYDEQESLSGVAALAADDAGRVTFLCATTGDYCDFLSQAAQKPAFVASVLGELKRQGIEDITLTNLPANSDSVAALRQTSGQIGFRYFARTAYLCAQVCLAALPRRPAGNKPVLPRKKMLRRFLNAMGREQPVHLEHARTWEEVQPILHQFMQAHVARFLVTGRISNLASPERRLFLEELARLLSEAGWLKLTRMMSGEKVFAWNYGFQFHDTWFWYQPTFDSDLEKFSPGFCLLAKIIEEAADTPALKTVDLGLGAEEYKDRSMNQSRETLYVTLRSSATRQLRELVRYHAARVVQSSPQLEAVVHKGAEYLRLAQERIRRDGAAATISRLFRRFGESLWSESRVFFFEWNGSVGEGSCPAKLEPLGLNRLAAAASQYSGDKETAAYLIRSAARLRSGAAEGFALVDREGRILHLAWAASFDGFFLSELNAKVTAPGANCVMLFDCWTPREVRGHGYYGRAANLIARRMHEEGKWPWIFSAAGNAASVRGLEKAGFERRYALVRQRVIGWQRIKGKTPRLDAASRTEASAHV